MFEIILGFIAAFLCVAGAVSLLKSVALRLTAPRSSNSRMYVVLLKGNNADMELRLSLEATEWDTGLKRLKTVAVDCGIPPEISDKCRRLCNMYGALYLDPGGFTEDVGTYVSDQAI